MPSLIHVLRRPQALRRTDQLPPGLSWWLRYSQDWLVLWLVLRRLIHSPAPQDGTECSSPLTTRSVLLATRSQPSWGRLINMTKDTHDT